MQGNKSGQSLQKDNMNLLLQQIRQSIGIKYCYPILCTSSFQLIIILKVSRACVQTFCIEKDSYMDAI